MYAEAYSKGKGCIPVNMALRPSAARRRVQVEADKHDLIAIYSKPYREQRGTGKAITRTHRMDASETQRHGLPCRSGTPPDRNSVPVVGML